MNEKQEEKKEKKRRKQACSCKKPIYITYYNRKELK